MDNPPRLGDLPDVLGVAETAAVLRLSKSSVYEAIREGTIPAVRIRRRIIVPKSAVERLLERAEDGSPPAGRRWEDGGTDGGVRPRYP